MYAERGMWPRWAEGDSSRVCIVVSGGGGDTEIHFFVKVYLEAQIVQTLAHLISNTLPAIITLAVIFFVLFCFL